MRTWTWKSLLKQYWQPNDPSFSIYAPANEWLLPQAYLKWLLFSFLHKRTVKSGSPSVVPGFCADTSEEGLGMTSTVSWSACSATPVIVLPLVFFRLRFAFCSRSFQDALVLFQTALNTTVSLSPVTTPMFAPLSRKTAALST